MGGRGDQSRRALRAELDTIKQATSSTNVEQQLEAAEQHAAEKLAESEAAAALETQRLNDDINHLREALATTREELGEARGRADALESEVEARRQPQAGDREYDKMVAELDASNGQLAAIRAEARELRDELADVQQRLARERNDGASRKSLAEDNAKLADELKALKVKQAGADRDLRVAQEAKRAAEAALAAERDASTARESAVRRLREENQQLKEAADEARRECTRLDTMLRNCAWCLMCTRLCVCLYACMCDVRMCECVFVTTPFFMLPHAQPGKNSQSSCVGTLLIWRSQTRPTAPQTCTTSNSSCSLRRYKRNSRKHATVHNSCRRPRTRWRLCVKTLRPPGTPPPLLKSGWGPSPRKPKLNKHC